MKTTSLCLSLVAALALGACSSMSGTSATSSAPAGDNQPDPTVLLVPVQITDPALRTGCWAQFYSKREFQGDMMTLVGPANLLSLDKGTARALQREIDSLTVGPKATLEVYEHAMFRDKTVAFPANSREGGLIRKLGFTGRIEAMRLRCS